MKENKHLVYIAVCRTTLAAFFILILINLNSPRALHSSASLSFHLEVIKIKETWRFIRIQNEEIWIWFSCSACFIHTRRQRALSRRNVWCVDTHAAIAVAELNIKQKRFFKWWNVKTINTRLRKYMIYVCFSSYLHVINKLCEKIQYWLT